jgi:hypothetical protein
MSRGCHSYIAGECFYACRFHRRRRLARAEDAIE